MSYLTWEHSLTIHPKCSRVAGECMGTHSSDGHWCVCLGHAHTFPHILVCKTEKIKEISEKPTNQLGRDSHWMSGRGGGLSDLFIWNVVIQYYVRSNHSNPSPSPVPLLLKQKQDIFLILDPLKHWCRVPLPMAMRHRRIKQIKLN
jgi:hypothetical protein